MEENSNTRVNGRYISHTRALTKAGFNMKNLSLVELWGNVDDWEKKKGKKSRMKKRGRHNAFPASCFHRCGGRKFMLSSKGSENITALNVFG